MNRNNFKYAFESILFDKIQAIENYELPKNFISNLIFNLFTCEVSYGYANRFPTSLPNKIALMLCLFNKRFYTLHFGRFGGKGINYKWLGIQLSVWY